MAMDMRSRQFEVGSTFNRCNKEFLCVFEWPWQVYPSDSKLLSVNFI